MRTLLLCICALIMAFMLVSCQTSSKAKAPSETSKAVEPLVPSSFNLNGRWKTTAKWKNEYNSGTVYIQYEIVQKGKRITYITIPSGPRFIGTLKGNIIDMEPTVFYGSNGIRNWFPAREIKISQDGNTLTSKFDYDWRGEAESINPGSMTVITIREQIHRNPNCFERTMKWTYQKLPILKPSRGNNILLEAFQSSGSCFIKQATFTKGGSDYDLVYS